LTGTFTMSVGARPIAPPAADADLAAAAAIAVIKDEHLAIASVLYGLRSAIRRIRDGRAPDFRLLRALLDYIVAFPEQLHHPKEDRHLFAALVRRDPLAAPLVAGLEAEHVEGAAMIAALAESLAGYAAEGAPRFAEFARAADAYVEFHWRHMTKEEDLLLPLARRRLTPGDWARIARAFRDNDNPLSGVKPRDEADSLYRRILALAPAGTRGA
jgi:hemerythrin-like domain-containing protein